MGQYFRLFAHEVFAADTNNTQNKPSQVLYLDSDVVIMANLAQIWKQRNNNYWFQWGMQMVSACIIINTEKIADIWNWFRNTDTRQVKHIMEHVLERHIADDQMILQVVNLTHPEKVGILPPAWDVSYVDGPWHKNGQTTQPVMPQYRAAVGMLHFNGGGASKDAYMQKHEVFTKLRAARKNAQQMEQSWGLAGYYADLPWPQARFMAESLVEDTCFTVELTVLDV